MKATIIYVGLDVDDTQYHGTAFDKATGEVIDFKCRPTLKCLLGQLDNIGKHFPECSLRLCYEASYIGYCLQRDLIDKGFHCDVVAPTSTPAPRGRAIKTDRIDAGQSAQYYVNDLLTIVQASDPKQEQDLLRTRQNLLKQRADLRKHVQSLLRRNGLHYKAETGNKTHWTRHHHVPSMTCRAVSR